MVQITAVHVVALLSVVSPVLSSAVPRASGLAAAKYKRLPLGSVKAKGWLLDQVNLQSKALAGKLHEFYPYVKDGAWTGGSSTYSNLHEGPVYYFNGAIAAAGVSDNQELLDFAKAFVDYNVQHQGSDGWIGPEPRFLWGRMLYLLGAVQYAELHRNDQTTVKPLLDSIYKFVNLTHANLQTTTYDPNTGGSTTVETWGAVRTQEYQYVLQNLYEEFPRDAATQQMLLADAKRVKEVGDLTEPTPKWEDYFTDGKINKDGYGTVDQRSHGVNVAQALKQSAINWRLTNARADLDSHAARWNLVYKYHGNPAGHFQADEHLAGLESFRGAEMCLIVETMFSAAVSYHILGGNDLADKAEAMAYNSLPGTATGDFWHHQYLQQSVQIYSGNFKTNPFRSDGAYSNVMGLEPNYPCCTVNHGQGFPKFVANSWAATADGTGLLHMLLGPSQVTTTVNGGQVVVLADTNYPFENSISYTISAAKSFNLLLRIPGWTKGASYSINGGSMRTVSTNGDSQQVVSLPAGKSTVTLNLPQATMVKDTGRGTAHLTRGPLTWGIDLPYSTQIINEWSQFNNANVKDLQLNRNVDWALAIDPNSLHFIDARIPRGKLPSPVFDGNASPYQMSALACPFDWQNHDGQWATSLTQKPSCNGPMRNITLKPYGVSKLRVAEIPLKA